MAKPKIRILVSDYRPHKPFYILRKKGFWWVGKPVDTNELLDVVEATTFETSVRIRACCSSGHELNIQQQ